MKLKDLISSDDIEALFDSLVEQTGSTEAADAALEAGVRDAIVDFETCALKIYTRLTEAGKSPAAAMEAMAGFGMAVTMISMTIEHKYPQIGG